MTETISLLRRAGWPLTVAVAAILLWLLYAATAGDPVLGQPPVRPAVQIAALAATCLMFVLAIGWLIEQVILPAGTAPPTALQRTVMYGLLSFAAGCVALTSLGYDLRVVLATSAIGSAIVGFAMQPTLGGVISGMALNVDRTIHVGDGIVYGNETIQVESLNWRNVTGRRRNGAVAVIPNAKLADGELQVLPHNRAIRSEIVVKAPGTLSPQQVADIVSELISDLAELDPARPIAVAPVQHELDGSAVPYSVRYWVIHYWDAEAVEGEVFRRLWYGFRRHRFAGTDESEKPDITELLAAAAPDVPQDIRHALQQEGEILIFAPGERVVAPERHDGWSFMLLRGDALGAPEYDVGGKDAQQIHLLDQLGRDAAVRYLATCLAAHIGPYAEFAVRKLSRTAADLDELCRNLADEIPDGTARAQFLADMRPAQAKLFRPGVMLRSRRDAAGWLVCEPRLKARGELLVLAIPPALSASMEAGPADAASAQLRPPGQ